MTRLLRTGAAAFALLLSVVVAHSIASDGSHGVVEPMPPPAHGFEVKSVTGAPDIAAALLQRFATEYLNRTEVDGSYLVDVTVRIGGFDEDTLSVHVDIFWLVTEKDGPILGVARQSERLLVSDLNQFPDLIWPAAAEGVAPGLIHLIRRWEAQKTRS